MLKHMVVLFFISLTLTACGDKNNAQKSSEATAPPKGKIEVAPTLKEPKADSTVKSDGAGNAEQ